MSAEKGGALVRSPPGLVGVDTFNAHIGKGTKWEHPTPPHVPLSGNQSQQQRNASVTKISSEGKGTFNSKNARRKKQNDKRIFQNGVCDEEEGSCGCEASTRLRQLEHDFTQLNKIHEAVLKGLHQQMEELKQKNKDLTFQLLMGPYATSVHVDVPQSPESDISNPKEENKKEDKSTSTSETELDTTPQQEEGVEFLDNDQPTMAPGMKTSVQRRQRKGRSADPRQVRSLDMELLEEEADELRKELEEEKTKNRYLLTLTEDLKRQIREETGAWNPPQLPVTKRIMKPPLQPMPINIASLDSQMQRSEALQLSQTLPTNHLNRSNLDYQNLSNIVNKKYEKSRPTLPVIRRQVNDVRLSAETQVNFDESLVEPKMKQRALPQTKPDDYVNKRSGPAPLTLKNKNKVIPQLADEAPQDKTEMLLKPDSEQPTSLANNPARNSQKPRRKRSETNESNENLQRSKQPQPLLKSRNRFQEFPRTPSTDPQRQRDQSRSSETKELSQNDEPKRSSSGSRSKVRGSSRSHSTSSRDSTKIGKQGADYTSMISLAKTGNSEPVAAPEVKPLQPADVHPSVKSKSKPSTGGDIQAEHSQKLDLQQKNKKRTKISKTEASTTITVVGSSITSVESIVNSEGSTEISSESSIPIHQSSEVNMASSSSSFGSLTTGNVRPKNKGRPHRRGRGRNKKETTENKEKGEVKAQL